MITKTTLEVGLGVGAAAGGNLRFLLFHAAWVCHEHILHVYNFQKRKDGKKQRDSDSSSFQCVSYELLTLSGSVGICVEIRKALFFNFWSLFFFFKLINFIFGRVGSPLMCTGFL